MIVPAGRRTRWWIVVLVLAVVASAVFVVARHRARTALPAGTAARTLDVDGVERSYRLHRPGDLDAEPALVLVLHGGGGSAAQAEGAYGWDAVADQEGFAVAYADGLHRTWNAGTCCGRSQADDVDDIGFLTALVDTLTDELDVDPDRVYLAGMSNGAMMGYAFACATDRLAALGAVSGTMLVACDAPAPLSVAHIHGTADQSVLVAGGTGSGAGHVTAPPLADVLGSWRAVDGCAAPEEQRGGDVLTSTATCPDGRNVDLVTIDGAGHQWPGSEQGRPGADPPSDALDATAYLWNFFAAHPRS